MATDFSKPSVTDNYAALMPAIRQALIDLAKGLDPVTSGAHTNVPADIIRWSSASGKWETFNGTSWVSLAATYAISISGNAATATSLNGGSVTATTGAFSSTLTATGAVTLGSTLDVTGVVTAPSIVTTAVSGQQVNFGGSAARGFYADATNVAIRCTGGGGTIRFQGPTGAATWGSIDYLGNLTVSQVYASFFNGSGANLTGTANSLIAGLGVGQTWQNLTASHALTTSYTNSTGRPILVEVCVLLSAGGTVYFNQSSYRRAAGNSGSSSALVTVGGLVPAGGSYSVNISPGSGSLDTWSELR